MGGCMNEQINIENLKRAAADVKKLPLQQIIRRDVKLNYAGMSAQEGMAELERLKKEGAGLVRFLNTIFIVTDSTGGRIKFHTMSGDSKKSFLLACLLFYFYLKKLGYDEAVTSFTNPAVIENLLGGSINDLPSWLSIQETDDAYQLEVDLNGLG